MANETYAIGQLALASGTKAETIRYYERVGLMRAPPRTAGGYRQYDETDLRRLLFVRRSRHLGFSLATIRALLELSDSRDAPCTEVDARVAQHLEEVRKRIARLRALESELQRLSACCRGGGAVEDCRIIETLSNEPAALDGRAQPTD